MTQQEQPAIPRPKLDPFTEDMAQRFGEALDTARATDDYSEVMRVSNLLAAEAMIPADNVLAMGLFKLSARAAEAGEHDEAEALRVLMTTLCSEAAIRITIGGALLGVGLRQGWLPAESHDVLMNTLRQGTLGPESRVSSLMALAERIERREGGAA